MKTMKQFLTFSCEHFCLNIEYDAPVRFCAMVYDGIIQKCYSFINTSRYEMNSKTSCSESFSLNATQIWTLCSMKGFKDSDDIVKSQNIN